MYAPVCFSSPVTDTKLDQSESLDNPRYSPSDESGMSQNDVTPQHSYTMKSHHSLLKQHLRETTAEKSRLEETAADLGEKTEKLKYELADAREASRSRDEVIALLQSQLKRMEEMYTECLEEIQGYRLRLGNQEQELRHLKDVCNKFDEEKENLNEIIRANEAEKADLDKALAANGEERVVEITTQLREKEKEQQEMKMHLLHLEEEKQKSLEEIDSLERKNHELEEKLDRSVSKIRVLGEEKAGLSVKSTGSQEESRKWQELYESCLVRLEQLATNCVEARDLKSSPSANSEDFRHELRCINEKLQELKDQYDLIWQDKVQGQVSNGDQEQLIELVDKLRLDLETSMTNQCRLETELRETRNELAEARRLTQETESSNLFEELKKVNVELRQQSEQTRSQIDVRDEDLKVKLNSLNDLNHSVTCLQGTLNVLEDLRRQKDDFQVRFNELVIEKVESDRQLSDLLKKVDTIEKLKAEPKESEGKLVVTESVLTQTDVNQTESSLKLELENVKDYVEELREELESRDNKPSLKVAETQTIDIVVEKTVPLSEYDTLSNDFTDLEAELERTLVVLKDARTAANNVVRDNNALKQELEEMKQKIEQYERELEERRKKIPCMCRDRKLEKVPENKQDLRIIVRIEQEKTTGKVCGGYKRKQNMIEAQEEKEMASVNLLNEESSAVRKSNPSEEQKESLSKPSSKSGAISGVSAVSCVTKETIQEETKEEESSRLDPGSKNPSQTSLNKEIDNGSINNVEDAVDNIDDKSNKTRTIFARSATSGTTNSCSSSMALTEPDNKSSVLNRVHNLEKRSTTGIEQDSKEDENAELRRKLQLEKERLKENEQIIRDLKDEIVWLKGRTLASEKKVESSDFSIGHKASCSNDEEFRKKVIDLEQKVRDENNKRFALEVQVNKLKYDLQEKMRLERELAALHDRLDRDFVSRYELDHLRRSYELALNKSNNAVVAEKKAARDEDKLREEDDHVLRNQLRDWLAGQEAGEQRLQEARQKLRTEVANADATCSYAKDKRDQLAKEGGEKRDAQKQRQILDNTYNVRPAKPVIVIDVPLPLHRTCSASCTRCNHHPTLTPGHTSCVKTTPTSGHTSCVKNAPTPGHTSCVKNTPTPGHTSCVKNMPTSGHTSCVKTMPTSGHTSCVKPTPTPGHTICVKPTLGPENSSTYSDSYRAMMRHELDKSIRKHADDSTSVAPPVTSRVTQTSTETLDEEEMKPYGHKQ